MPISSNPQSLIIQPPLEAWIERTADGRLMLHWTPQADRITVYAGAHPDAIDHDTAVLIIEATSDPSAILPVPDGLVRLYYEVNFEGGPAAGKRLVVAERLLPLEGGFNLRDIGGYPTRDGRTVRWGRVYRAGSIAGLTPAGVDYLDELGLRLVCDVRSHREVVADPDHLPPRAIYWHRPLTGKVGRLRRGWALFHYRNQLQKALERAYTGIFIDRNGNLFHDFFQQAADPANLPLLIHCTAGKDRTGVTIALLLAALGVGDETIIADYSLSNYYQADFAGRLAYDMRPLVSLGFSEEQLRPFTLAEPRTMQATLAHIRGRYGSVREYLSRMAGVTPGLLQRLQDNLLT